MKSKKGFQSDIQALAGLKAASDAAKAAGEPLMSTAHLKPNAYTKAKAQVKSSFYYYFWGTATLAVVVGQFVVGTGFRRMAQAVDDLGATATILIELEDLKRRGDYQFIDFNLDYNPNLADPALMDNPLIQAYTK
tara:strand:- start:2255 stop:2659 length:405 start_codon:yes stop_codon:yes gene_type:complete